MEAGAHRGAQEWFRLMLDTGIAPGLHVLGFTVAGRRFRKALDDHWVEIIVIQSPSLHEARVRFTLHLRVTSRDEWAEQLRVRPYSLAPGRSRSGWEAPIGQLIHVGGLPIQDLWWELEAGRSFDSLAAEILSTIRNHALPAITHQTRAAG